MVDHRLIVYRFTIGNTPWWGRSVKAAAAFFSSRIIGVEIYCGPIRETCYYITDNLVEKGANTNLEVQRIGKAYACLWFLVLC